MRIARRKDIDVMKGIAIVAVILYHMGILETGYLGVDIFFLINGFLLVPNVIREIEEGSFNYLRFLLKRISRLLPILILACVFCFSVGYFVMLPDDYENLCESIIATCIFSNNILAGMTTKNYWDVVNEYKPLMHTWYLGILMEYYVLLPILLIVYRKVCQIICKETKCKYHFFLVILSIISFIFFILPIVSDSDKFYFLPSRFFEITVGGIVGYVVCYSSDRIKNRAWKIIIFCLLIAVLLVGGFVHDNTILIIMTVGLGCAFLLSENNYLNNVVILRYIGERCYSLYIWHQIFLAFYRYTISDVITIPFVTAVILSTFLASELSFKLIEHKTWKRKSIMMFMTMFLSVVFLSGIVYLRAGVVRDVPELGITRNNVRRNMHAEYCDRIYNFDVDFREDGERFNVLVVGNSFARDWGNILLESEYAEKINLSYSFSFSEELIDRIQQADCIFVYADKSKVPDYLWSNVKNQDKVWGIGTKNFGKCNGTVYFKRFTDSYFDLYVKMEKSYEELNDLWAKEWGNNYINLIKEVQNEDGFVRVLTPKNNFISQDCRHLTEAGAEYYAEILQLEQYFE